VKSAGPVLKMDLSAVKYDLHDGCFAFASVEVLRFTKETVEMDPGNNTTMPKADGKTKE